MGCGILTKDEMKKTMAYFQTAYRGFYEGKNPSDVLTVWYDAFAEEDASVVSIAAKNYVKSNVYPPTIAGLKMQINMIKTSETDTDLWGLIYKAASNGLYHSEEEFKKLPPECQSFIGSASALKDLAQTDVGTMNTVVKGQFLKRVEAIKQHKEVQRGLPAEVRQAIEESKRRMLDVEDYW